MEGVAGGGGRLPQANIASPFRWKGCAKDPQPGFAGAEALARGNHF